MIVALFISIFIIVSSSVLLYNLQIININNLSKEDTKIKAFLKQFNSWISLKNSIRIWLLFFLVTYGFLVGTYCNQAPNLKTIAITFLSSIILLILLNSISLKIFRFSIDIFHFINYF